ncbi:hypothetical protein [Agrobacterium rosae]|uniref:Uncharacterized protein n=1 Tax=Agrobacterium rosae TaxID=1972867 RepID=A0AAW9FI18_9HYPH|nr:hypothetical protein [Agrobacterium rosae]MDX8302816.1 hypothetical protein [Agrobacterium rosae]
MAKDVALLSEIEKKNLLYAVYGETNPIKAYEAKIISSILTIHTGEYFWRFQKGIFCKNCRRELTALDYLLSAFKSHSVEFIVKQICPEYEETGECDHEADAITVERIDVVERGTTITCVNCGTDDVSPTYDLYAHPGCKGYTIRMSPEMYNMLCVRVGI